MVGPRGRVSSVQTSPSAPFFYLFLAAYCNAHDNYHIATSVATISRRNIDARIDAAVSTTIDVIISTTLMTLRLLCPPGSYGPQVVMALR